MERRLIGFSINVPLGSWVDHQTKLGIEREEGPTKRSAYVLSFSICIVQRGAIWDYLIVIIVE